MRRLSSHAVIVGGSHQTKKMLSDFAEAAVCAGITTDPVVFTFGDAHKREEQLRCAVRTAEIVLAHGAGSMAIPRQEPLESVLMIAPHEPISKLGQAVVRNILNHLVGDTTSPRRDHLRVLAENVLALGFHPVRNLSVTGIASRSSTYELVQGGHIHSDCIGYFPMSDDEVYGPPNKDRLVNLEFHDHITGILQGGHNELMLDPGTVLINAQNVMRAGLNIAGARKIGAIVIE